MNRNITDPVEQIKNALRHHEEPYEQGAWEQFLQYRKRKQKNLQMMTVTGVAASLILAALLGVFVFQFGDDFSESSRSQFMDSPGFLSQIGPIATPGMTEFGESGPTPGSSTEIILTEPALRNFDFDRTEPRSTGGDFAGNEPADDTSLKSTGKTRPDSDDVRIDGEDSIHLQIITSTGYGPVVRGSLPILKPTSLVTGDSLPSFVTIFPQSLLPDRLTGRADRSAITNMPTHASGHIPEDDDTQKTIPDSRNRKMELGFAYSPLVNMHSSDSDLNMGIGVSLSRPISRNFSISSGLYLAQNNLQYRGSDEQTLFSTTSEPPYTRMHVDLMSIEVPLSITYSITKNFYLSTGISAATFLKEQYEYHYEYDTVVEQILLVEDDELRVVETKVSISEKESQTESVFRSLHLPAFYTFSTGYRTDAPEDYAISFEPFLKISAGRLTTRNIRYTTAGIQMILHF